MMLPVLSSELLVYKYMQNPAVVLVYDTSDFAVLLDIRLLTNSDDKVFVCNGI